MTRQAEKVASTPLRFRSDDDRWQAVVRRDARAAGLFFYAVTSTGVYCRPGCPARLPKRANVRFYGSAQDAERAGFRACRRCRPKQAVSADPHVAAVTEACRIMEAAGEPVSLAALAKAVHMSASHFHRVFKSLTGLTPKAYAMAHRRERLQRELGKAGRVTAAAYRAGFNSSGRLYATSSQTLGMQPAAFRHGGRGASIRYALGKSSLGAVLAAVSDRGVCAIALGDDPEALVADLKHRFPQAELIGDNKQFKRLLAKVVAFVERPATGLDLPLDIRGTAFQQRVWEVLSKIPCGHTASYSEIARRLGRPDAVRAVASAVAANQIAIAIPCHRAIRSDGSLSGFRWGVERKADLLRREREEP